MIPFRSEPVPNDVASVPLVLNERLVGLLHQATNQLRTSLKIARIQRADAKMMKAERSTLTEVTTSYSTST
jgi:hypothetical protein